MLMTVRIHMINVAPLCQVAFSRRGNLLSRPIHTFPVPPSLSFSRDYVTRFLEPAMQNVDVLAGKNITAEWNQNQVPPPTAAPRHPCAGLAACSKIPQIHLPGCAAAAFSKFAVTTPTPQRMQDRYNGQGVLK